MGKWYLEVAVCISWTWYLIAKGGNAVTHNCVLHDTTWINYLIDEKLSVFLYCFVFFVINTVVIQCYVLYIFCTTAILQWAHCHFWYSNCCTMLHYRMITFMYILRLTLNPCWNYGMELSYFEFRRFHWQFQIYLDGNAAFSGHQHIKACLYSPVALSVHVAKPVCDNACLPCHITDK